MKLACRFCGQHFHDVNHGDSWTEPDGRHHWIVSPSGLLTGDRKPEPVKKKKLEAIDLDDFLDSEPGVLLEVSPEPAVQEKPDGLV